MSPPRQPRGGPPELGALIAALFVLLGGLFVMIWWAADLLIEIAQGVK